MILKGRALLVYFLLVSYVGVGIGLLVNQEVNNVQMIAIAALSFIIGIIFHTRKADMAYLFAMLFNGFATGILLGYVMVYFEVQATSLDILIAIGIALVLYIFLALVASLTALKNAGFYVSMLLFAASFIYISSFLGPDALPVYGVLFIVQYIGIIYMIALMITGSKSEKLAYNCSSASMLIFVIAILAVIIIAVFGSRDSDSDSDLDLDFNGKLFGSSSSSGVTNIRRTRLFNNYNSGGSVRYHRTRSRYIWWYWLFDDCYYYDYCYFNNRGGHNRYYKRRKPTVEDEQSYLNEKKLEEERRKTEAKNLTDDFEPFKY